MDDCEYSAPSKYNSVYNYLFCCGYCLLKFGLYRDCGCRCNAVSSIAARSGMMAELAPGQLQGKFSVKRGKGAAD